MPCSRASSRARSGRRAQDERHAVLAGELEVRLVVRAQRLRALGGAQEMERREARQLDALVEDENRLDAAVGQFHRLSPSKYHLRTWPPRTRRRRSSTRSPSSRSRSRRWSGSSSWWSSSFAVAATSSSSASRCPARG